MLGRKFVAQALFTQKYTGKEEKKNGSLGSNIRLLLRLSICKRRIKTGPVMKTEGDNKSVQNLSGFHIVHETLFVFRCSMLYQKKTLMKIM